MEQQKKRGRSQLLLSFLFFALICGCIWVTNRSIHPRLPLPGEEPRLYSNQRQQDLRLTFVEAIRRARVSVHLAMFGLSDPSVLEALSERIRNQIPTTIYYDPVGSLQLTGKLVGARLIPVRAGGLMHQKMLVIDGTTLFLGSANMTSASLSMHDNLVVGFHSPALAQFLLSHSPTYSGSLRARVGGQDLELWLLPDSRGHALSHLRTLLHTASSSIRIALFTFTHPSLIDDLIAARARRVSVTVILDAHSAFGASRQALERLRAAGVRVLLSQGIPLLHHKFLWIDDRTLVCGSANWTKAAFCNNSDSILILHSLSSVQRKFLSRLWNRLQTEAASQ